MPGYMYGPKAQFLDSSGNPLVGGKVYIYEPDQYNLTEDSFDNWANAVSNVLPQSNPVILDSRGEAIIILRVPVAVRLTDADGTLIWSVPHFAVADAS